jgi:sugar O-acyltransferase (sialic acid O-acetyltransferase NeuD family)
MILGIYGMGGLGREVRDIAERINLVRNVWSKIYFVDDNFSSHAERTNLNEALSFEKFQSLSGKLEVTIAVGEPLTRSFLYEKLVRAGIELVTICDPSSIISNTAILGRGCIIGEFATIHANVKIGDNSVVQPFCCVGHDISVGRHTVISTTANIGGGTQIGNKVYLGMNCSILQNLRIDDEAIVAMGAAVFRDVESNTTVIGNPARTTKRNESNRALLKPSARAVI